MIKLSFFAGVEYNNKLYFSAYNHNGLYEMDLIEKKIKLVMVFKEKQITMLHRAAFLYKNNAWFIPQSGEYIAKVNLNTFEIKYLKFSYVLKDENSKNIYHAFVCGKKVGKFLYLIPRSIDTLVVINMETDEVREIRSVINPQQEITMDGLVEKDDVFIFFKKAGYYRKIDLKTENISDYDLSVGVCSVVGHKENLWILTEESKALIKYDINKGQINNKIELEGIDKYNGNIENDDKVIFLPFKSDSYLCLDMESEKAFAEEVKDIKMAEYYNKLTVIDSDKRKLVTLGGLACIAEIYPNGQIIYTKVEGEPDIIFDGMLKYLKTYEEWKDLYETFSESGLELQIGLEGYLSFIMHMPSEKIG